VAAPAAPKAAVAPKATTPPKATPKTTTKSAAPKVAAPKAANVTPSGKTVTVKACDTLSQLALTYHVTGGWKALFAANTSIVKDANLIYVGQTLSLPA
jgi:nucleoid-associated protein YgaU